MGYLEYILVNTRDCKIGLKQIFDSSDKSEKITMLRRTLVQLVKI